MRLPAVAFGAYVDGESSAINLAQWAFAAAERTHGDPADAARAAAAVDYLAADVPGDQALVTSPAPLDQELLAARHDVRAAIGVAQRARPQLVVRRLLAAAQAIEDEDPDATAAALRGGPFKLPPAQTLARLSDMPFLRAANLATQDAAIAYRGNSGQGAQ